VADAPLAVNLMAQETQATGESEKPKARGYYMPTRITVRYMDEKVIAQEGIPEWLAMAVKVIRENYPRYDIYLQTEGHIPSGDITLQAESSGAIGWNSNTTIGFSIEWIKPGAGGEKDWGMIAHELVHFVQNYRGGEGTGLPGWVTEGIADYMRHVFFEPEKEMRPFNARENYDGAYQVTAAFFMYIVDTYDKDFVKTLNESGRKRTYSEDIFEKSTGKNVEALWAEYDEKVRQPHMAARTKMVPAKQFPNLMKYKKEFDEYFATLKEESRPGQQQPGQGQPRQGQGRQRPPANEG